MHIKIINHCKNIFAVILILLITSCEKEMFVESYSNVFYLCTAYINSYPDSVTIYIDGECSFKKTPDTLKWLGKGEHTITLKGELFRDTSITFTTNESEVANVYVDYLASPRNYGIVNFSSTPSNASIYMKGAYSYTTITQIGKTPFTLTQLIPDNYFVKFTYPEHRADSARISIFGGKSINHSAVLQDTSIWVDYRINNSRIPHNYIKAVVKDKSNNVWIGTYGNGLAKVVNGAFTKYLSGYCPLPNNYINCLEVDKENNLWIGTIKGLAKFDGLNWTEFRKGPNGLSDDYITAIHADQNNNIWVGTINGLMKITNNQITVYNTENSGIGHNSISNIISDNQGNIWIGVSAGISRFNNGTWIFYSRERNFLSGNDVNCFAIAPDGTLLAAFAENIRIKIYGGLMKFDGSNWITVSVPGIPAGRIQNIYIDKKGNKWIASEDGFIIMKPDNSYAVYRGAGFAMYSNDVKDLLLDDNNVAWIGLFGGGLVKWKGVGL